MLLYISVFHDKGTDDNLENFILKNKEYSIKFKKFMMQLEIITRRDDEVSLRFF